MNTETRIGFLASEILAHKKRYYAGQSTISDAEFDALEDELRRLDPNHPVLSVVGYGLADEAQKVRHFPPMLSLEKTYEVSDVWKFIDKRAVICMDKLDGMALSLEYSQDGALVRASTRGNGTMGENVTQVVMHIPAIPKRIELPSLLGLETFEIRGEVFFPKSRFAEFEEQFDSYRNAVPGTFGRKEVLEAIPVLRVLGFCAYEAILRSSDGNRVASPAEFSRAFSLDGPSFLSRLHLLERLGFFSGYSQGLAVRTRANQEDELAQEIAARFNRERDYHVDGLVFRLDDDEDWQLLGATAHHPRGSLAFKQTGETAVTTIIAIEPNIGRSGKVSFRARLSPVSLSGATISYATLHNAEFIESGHYAPGALVRIKRSGEVIPAIIGLEAPSAEPYELPTTCPCGYPLTRKGPDLLCLQKSPCIHKDQESLVHFVHHLGVMGVSDKIILKLRDAGLVREPSDLFRLRREDLLQLEGFGEKSAENLLGAIEQHRVVPLAVFLTALGISRGGAVKCREAAKRFRTLDAVRAASTEDFMSMRGWASKNASEFVASLEDKRAIIDRLLTVVTVEAEAAQAAATDHVLAGRTVCITGALSRPREEYREVLESVGAKLSESVSAKTAFLVCNEQSGSSKSRKALELGVAIITEQQFIEMLSADSSSFSFPAQELREQP